MKKKHSEHSEQAALFLWAKLKERDFPDLRWMFAIPNGGLRHPAVAKKLQNEGVKAGVFDVFLPCARGRFHGFFIEIKFGKNNLTPHQESFKAAMDCGNYFTAVCWSWQSAAEAILSYLSGE